MKTESYSCTALNIPGWSWRRRYSGEWKPKTRAGSTTSCLRKMEIMSKREISTFSEGSWHDDGWEPCSGKRKALAPSNRGDKRSHCLFVLLNFLSRARLLLWVFGVWGKRGFFQLKNLQAKHWQKGEELALNRWTSCVSVKESFTQPEISLDYTRTNVKLVIFAIRRQWNAHLRIGLPRWGIRWGFLVAQCRWKKIMEGVAEQDQRRCVPRRVHNNSKSCSKRGKTS